MKLFFERCKKLARLTSIMDVERRCNGFERAALLNWLKIIRSVEKQLTTTLCF